MSGQWIHGDPAKGSFIGAFEECSDGTWIAHGRDDGINNVSRLSTHGEPLWSNRIRGLRTQAMTSISTSWLPQGVVCTGAFDADGDGETDYSVVKAWDGDGRLLDEMVLTGGTTIRHANSITVSGATSDQVDFLVVGWIELSTDSFVPWVQRVTLHADDTLERGEERTYPALGLFRLDSVKRNPVDSVYYAGGNAYSNYSTIANGAVLELSDSLAVDWRTDLVTEPGLTTEISGEVDWTGAGIVATGSTEVEKAEAPANGGHWDGALIALLSPQGVVQWKQSVVLTAHTEWFYGSWVDGAYVYAAGAAASFLRIDTDEYFQYGLLTKIDLATGDILANYTFGDPGYGSIFLDVVVHGDQASCGGFTERKNTNTYRSWFVEIDFTRPAAVAVPGSLTLPEAHVAAAASSGAFIGDPRGPRAAAR